MTFDIREILAANLALLMSQSADCKTQLALAKRANVAQTTISNYLHPGRKRASANLEQIERIAKTLGVEPWMMIHPTACNQVAYREEQEIMRRLKELAKNSP